MRFSSVTTAALLLTAALGPVPLSAQAQVSIGVHLPGIDIGINQPTYPELVPVPGYPVYYAPGASSNYFFYDGRYWVLQGDDWYASAWYNGPWDRIRPEAVPVYVLRVPVRYYHRPPGWFGGWRREEAPRWGEHWGHDWERRRAGWDRRDRPAPRPAPLPTYQREYAGPRYPRPEEQRQLHEQNYQYQPREQPRGDNRGFDRQEGRGEHGRKRHQEN
jgi:hypothetical protein